MSANEQWRFFGASFKFFSLLTPHFIQIALLMIQKFRSNEFQDFYYGIHTITPMTDGYFLDQASQMERLGNIEQH